MFTPPDNGKLNWPDLERGKKSSRILARDEDKRPPSFDKYSSSDARKKGVEKLCVLGQTLHQSQRRLFALGARLDSLKFPNIWATNTDRHLSSCELKKRYLWLASATGGNPGYPHGRGATEKRGKRDRNHLHGRLNPLGGVEELCLLGAGAKIVHQTHLLRVRYVQGSALARSSLTL